jgi:small subunit ribosomal protein S20
MPNSKQAAKRLRQDKKKTEKNKLEKLNIAFIVRQFKKAQEAKDKAKAQELALKYQKAIDKATKHGIYHKNTAARKKSRLMARVNALK